MKISVALASYNGARFIEEQLASLAAQTRLPDELVVCDDGSNDGTVDLVDGFAANAPFRVRLERNSENLGYNRNFEKAVSLCEGDVIFISDQDDIWLPEKIETVVGVLEARPEVHMVLNNQFVAEGSGRPTGTRVLENSRALGYPDSNYVAGCCTAFRRELRPVLLPFSETLSYDSWISALAEAIGVRTLCDRPLQLYRRHGTNVTESVLNHSSPSVWLLIRTYGLADPRETWQQQIAIFRSMRRRLEEQRADIITLAGGARLAQGLASLDRQIEDLSRRLRLLSKSRLARIPSVVHLWRNGFYANFAGGKSAIKDIIRA